MSMPTGDSPQTAERFYQYLQSHQVPAGRVETWHVDWISLAWMWGFVIALVTILLFWVRQYRTTGHPEGITPLDTWAGHTTEGAGPATRFFVLLAAITTGYVLVIVVGHIVWGQKF
jgi:hypothetical protein